ncbi:hypothetical protein [Streptomyces gilvosporeus]|uniref:Glycosyl transferase n=1 Tax=Streptomyces gilvosporeus TaxID=553510 RepID=A0A1V0TK39_9ACTN|nr:hypothetical protein [Streptomyces gilvosporeus]ARF53263.1 hypothetical protein B1H19_02970 [Streptomyces gilvosporeus]
MTLGTAATDSAPAQSPMTVTLACTHSYFPLAVAAICSLRTHNHDVPVRLFLDQQPKELARIAAALRITARIRRIPAHDEHTRSRLLKIQAMTEAPSGPCLHIDADTLLLDDVDALAAQSPIGPAAGVDVRMLLRRPKVQTLWTNGRYNFTDPALSQEQITQLVNDTFGLAYTTDDLGAMPCWNSGVIYGAGAVLRQVAMRWLDRYRRMITGPQSKHFVPNDQLCLWLTLLEMSEAIPIGELPLRWNFMPGRALRLAPGTEELNDDELADVAILHLSVNKDDDWALRRREAVLAAAGVTLSDTVRRRREEVQARQSR